MSPPAWRTALETSSVTTRAGQRIGYDPAQLSRVDDEPALAGGQVHTDEQTVKTIARRFDSVRSEVLPASLSARRLTELANELAQGYP